MSDQDTKELFENDESLSSGGELIDTRTAQKKATEAKRAAKKAEQSDAKVIQLQKQLEQAEAEAAQNRELERRKQAEAEAAQKAAEENRSEIEHHKERARNFTFEVYPESAVENWEQKLDAAQVAWIKSPLHDRDVHDEDSVKKNPNVKVGDPKKPHYHIFMVFGGKKSIRQIIDIARIASPTIGYVEPVRNSRSMIRYFTHIDHPQKAQYDKHDIELHGGIDVDIDSYFLTKMDLKQIRREIFEFQCQNNIFYACDVIDYARQFKPEWLDVIICSDRWCEMNMTSRRLKARDKREAEKYGEADTSRNMTNLISSALGEENEKL